MKRLLLVFLCVFALCGTLCGCGKEKQESEQLTGLHHAQIEIKDYGMIELELDADSAPITVNNFVSLAKSGFYDGLTIHRVAPNFVIQGGDPKGNGFGGSGTTIKGEFLKNGIDNSISHTRGTISMARSSDSFDSASSQFFIVQSDARFLDGQYAAFGHVTSGMEVVDEICDKVTGDPDSGLVEKKDQPVITAIRIID